MIGILFVSSHIDKRLFKNKYLKINEIFLVRKKECCLKKMLMIESLLLYRSRSRSKMDWLRKTSYSTRMLFYIEQ